MRVFPAIFLAAFFLPALSAQSTSGPSFEIDFSNPALSPSHWTLSFDPDGHGHFHSDSLGSQSTAPPSLSAAINAPDLDRDIQLSPAFTARVYQNARQHKFFNEDCESHLKVAFLGTKRLTYRGPDGEGHCEFNYSKDKSLQDLGGSLLAVAETILEGARLASLLQHDRLGLDKETEYLVSAATDGRVQQLGTIKSILQRLADDPTVMDRVRKRARALLARVDG